MLYVSTYMRFLGIVKFIAVESLMVVAGLQGEGNRKLLLNGYRVSDEEDKILKRDGGDS